MTDQNTFANDVYYLVQWQKFPKQPDDVTLQEEIHEAVIRGIRELFIDTGRALSFSHYEIIDDAETGVFTINYDFPLDEEEYAKQGALAVLMALVQASVNNIVSYTTNALSVANADKPYAYIGDTISTARRRQKDIFLRMVRYTHMS